MRRVREHDACPATAWTVRAEDERRAAALFSGLQSLLADADVPVAIVQRVHAIVGDELAHADMCARMALEFGAPRPLSQPLPRSAYEPCSAEARRARALEIVLVDGAISETISCAILTAARRPTEQAAARGILGRILEDEASHARCFWDLFDQLLAHGDGEHLRDFVARALGTIERAQVVPMIRSVEQGDRFDPAWSKLGVLAPAAKVDAFYAAIDGSVLPALTARGLDGPRAWASRHSSRRA